MRYIYCHPLFDERKCAHRFSYHLARVFEDSKLLLERFDYQGTGEADGSFCDVTMDSLQNDIARIAGNDKVCLIGTRFGAMAAFEYCCRGQSGVHALILIEPIVSGQGYVEYLFRKQHLKDVMTGNGSEAIDSNGYYNLEGYKTSGKFIEQIRHHNLVEKTGQLNADAVYIIQISASLSINSEYTRFVKCLKESGIPARIEVFNLPAFWERIPDGDYTAANEKILEWCR